MKNQPKDELTWPAHMFTTCLVNVLVTVSVFYAEGISKRSFFLRFGLPSILISHENGTFIRRSSRGI